MAPHNQHNQNPPRGGYGGNRPNNRPSASISLDDICFGKELKDLNPELFAQIAQDKAKAIAAEGSGRRNKSTQLRKFYDELVMWHDKVFEHGIPDREARYKELAPFIKMLCAKVTYAKGRDHVSQGFEKLFTHVVRNITNPETLKQAKLFIEAFMGFYKAEEQ